MKVYFLRHLQVLFDTLGRMIRSPLPTFMAIMVLSIAITLPLLLFKIAESLDSVETRWQGKPQISLFLTLSGPDVDNRSREFGQELLGFHGISDIEYISPIEALTEFKRTSEFGPILDRLPENPLPPLLVVFPNESLTNGVVEQMATQLSLRPEVDTVSYDGEWIQRFSGIITVFKQVLYVLAVLMGLGIVLIVSNTAHLEILSRRDEIEIVDQIGGTRMFIRRPFLYFGALQGVFGALLALILTNASLLVISYPVNTLASLYETDFKIQWVGFASTAAVVFAAGVLGWVAARVTIGNYLKRL
ncbi:MAG: FtsX-like permease family protein [Gammaproteobacteria bacterium]|nr:FtsX-like permease family protein [Gammaproteobacteria bacterium]